MSRTAVLSIGVIATLASLSGCARSPFGTGDDPESAGSTGQLQLGLSLSPAAHVEPGPQCKERKANAPPVIRSLQIEGGKHLCSNEAARLKAVATDPDGDQLELIWSLAGPGRR
jgi:hypothetical protein